MSNALNTSFVSSSLYNALPKSVNKVQFAHLVDKLIIIGCDDMGWELYALNDNERLWVAECGIMHILDTTPEGCPTDKKWMRIWNNVCRMREAAKV